MNLPRVYSDFNGGDPQGRLSLTCVGTFIDLERLNLVLQEGDRLTLYDDECEVEATVRWSDEAQSWVGEIDRSAIRLSVDGSNAWTGKIEP